MFCKVYKGNPLEPFFNFPFKNCKGTCFFYFVGYFIPYFSGNVGNELNPKMRRMAVLSSYHTLIHKRSYLKNQKYRSLSQEKYSFLL